MSEIAIANLESRNFEDEQNLVILQNFEENKI